MKIRWTATSVRLRISPSELESLQRGEIVAELLSVPGGWQAVLVPNALQSDLRMENNALRLSLSPKDLAHLTQPEQEGVYFEMMTAPDVRYYVEKDFPCAHPRSSEAMESASETFASTLTFSERKAVSP